jgi:RNA polymerase sigma-70 factor (ECF subfamily)
MKLFVRSSKKPDLHQWEDDRLLKAWRVGGNRDCFDVLYNRYVHLVYGVCRKHLEHAADCKAVCMEVFGALLELPQEKAIRSLPSWLYATARNSCITYRRQLAKAPATEAEESFFEENASEFMENEGLARLLNREHPQLLELLPKAMAELEDNQRHCLELFYLEDYSYQAISRETGFSLKQVKSYLQNGKRKLGIILKRYLAEGK